MTDDIRGFPAKLKLTNPGGNKRVKIPARNDDIERKPSILMVSNNIDFQLPILLTFFYDVVDMITSGQEDLYAFIQKFNINIISGH